MIDPVSYLSLTQGQAASGAQLAEAFCPSFARICGDCATGAAKSGPVPASAFEPLTMRD
jgi:hypothetical protein